MVCVVSVVEECWADVPCCWCCSVGRGGEGGALTDKSCSIIMLTHEGRKAEIPRIICLPDYCLLEGCTLSDPKGSLKAAVYGLHK